MKQQTDIENITDLINRLTEKLDTMSVPIDERKFSMDEYRKVFPRGSVKTPIGEVKIGKNQFSKLAEKDNGKRQGLIGAMYQTLSDPIVIIQEEENGRSAYIFIKSFKIDGKTDIIVSVVVTIEDQKVAISTYKRKKREVISKIKKAGVMTYEKSHGTSPTNGIDPPSLI
ncbi:MAG: PBECR2 nuclease fold domain-containing protein [Treponema sp.]|nr:PBECR2 nuclease fold domain-containing protein [Treponema sp.]